LLESGLGEVYISPYPNVSGGRWQVSNGGGASSPRWSRDGRELFYRGLGSTRSRMFSFKLPADGALGTVRPQLLFDVPDLVANPGLDEFDVGPDGRFLIGKVTATKRDVPQVIVNWFETLKRTRNP
jgi:hypothetical protein